MKAFSGITRRTSTLVNASATSDAGEKIGFIGLNELGLKMVKTILSTTGKEVVASDESAQALHAAEAAGAEVVPSPAALASYEDVRVVFSMLPSESALRQAYLGRKGVVKAEGGVKPSLFLDCSTVGPFASQEIAAEVQRCPLHHAARPFPDCSAAHPAMLDAPVSGESTAASAGTLTFMVGGSREAAKAAEPYMRMLGRSILYCGKSGNGQAAKTCVNMAWAIQMASIAEVMAHGTHLGLDSKDLAGILNTSSSRCWSGTDYHPVPGIMEGVPSSRDYSPGLSTSEMSRQLEAAMASDQPSGIDLPMTKCAFELYQKIASQHPGEDFSSIYKHLYMRKP